MIGMLAYVIYIFMQKNSLSKLFANSGDTDQMLHSVTSDLGLHCLQITLLGVSRLKWVNWCVQILEYCAVKGLFCQNI